MKHFALGPDGNPRTFTSIKSTASNGALNSRQVWKVPVRPVRHSALQKGLRNLRLVTAFDRHSSSASMQMAAHCSSRERDCIIAKTPQRRAAVKGGVSRHAARVPVCRACSTAGEVKVLAPT